jgi:hypothetical protein
MCKNGSYDWLVNQGTFLEDDFNLPMSTLKKMMMMNIETDSIYYYSPLPSTSPSFSFSVFVTVCVTVCVLGFNKTGFILRVFQWLAWWSTVQSLKFFACRRGFILQDSLVQDVLLGTN